MKRVWIRWGPAALAVALALLGGCAAVPALDDYAESWSRTPDSLRTSDAREWFSLQGQAVIRNPEQDDGVDDALGVSLIGGWDLIGDRVRLSLEGQVGWSRHDTQWTEALDRGSDDLDLLLVGLGLRLWLLPAAGRRFAPYVRAGGFGLYALDDVDDEFTAGVPADFDENVYGGYVGGGLEVRYASGCYLGPFFTHYRSENGRLEINAVGLGARFRF